MLTQYTIEGFENIQVQGFHALKQIENKLSELYRLSGYHQVATPTFEAYDFFTSEEGLPGESLFKLIDCEGKVLALKPDATMQIARMAAINHHDPEAIVKFCYRTELYRNFAAPEIVKKETTQMGVEVFGNRSPECDGEIIALAIRSLLVNGITNIHIDMGHVGFINRLLDDIELTAEERSRLLQLIETKNLGDIKAFLATKSIDENIKAAIMKLPKLYGAPQAVFTDMEKLCVNDGMTAVLNELKAIYRHLETIGLAQYISFDIGFTSQMGYYTDLIFKAYINGWGEPLIGGGRYDALSAKFGIDRPACGFGVDLLGLMDYCEQHELLAQDDAKRIVLLYTETEKAKAYQTLISLQEQKVTAEMFKVEAYPEIMIEKLLRNPMYASAEYYMMVQNESYFCDIKAKRFEKIDSITERVVTA